jgi:hypothetical protein
MNNCVLGKLAIDHAIFSIGDSWITNSHLRLENYTTILCVVGLIICGRKCYREVSLPHNIIFTRRLICHID